MYQLEVPKVLKRGDTIALISISGGRAGDEDMLYRYEAGKRRLEEIWGVHVIPTPNTSPIISVENKHFDNASFV